MSASYLATGEWRFAMPRRKGRLNGLAEWLAERFRLRFRRGVHDGRHQARPHATIYVVEAPSDGPTDLFAAVAVAGQCVAANGGGEVSMSWGFS